MTFGRIQWNGDDDNGDCNLQNTGKLKGDQFLCKPGMKATAVDNTMRFVFSGFNIVR